MTRRSLTASRGFTLIELMIAVAIIGVLASVAIPSFQNYQLTSKQSEAFTNLSALAKHQKMYFAEYNIYIGVLSEPLGTTGQPPGPNKRDVAGVTAGFDRVGWTPDGDVFFDYDTNTSLTGCACPACFTAAAYGDLDAANGLSIIMYAQPDENGNWCSTLQGAPPRDPPIDGGGNRILSEVVRHLGADRY